MRYINIILLLFSVPLYAQTIDPPNCDGAGGGPAYTGFVEFAALDAWEVCDMRCSGQLNVFETVSLEIARRQTP